MDKKHITFSSDHASIDDNVFFDTEKKIGEYINHCNTVVKNQNYIEDEASLNCPTDKKVRQAVSDMVAKKVSNKLRYIVVCGIGGSNLGTKAIYESIIGTVDPHADSHPKIIFVDTVSAHMMMDVVALLKERIVHADEILINVVTKSGGTTETIGNFETLYNALSERFQNLKDRVVVTTNEGSKLWNAAEKVGIDRIAIKEKVGGRFSVFSAVGLFPLQCAGLDVKALLEGAADMRDECLKGDAQSNPALASAAITAHHHRHGVHINNTFLFNPELESVGKWYRQLTGESIGKRENLDGEEVREGITPIVSIGSTDLHSMAQLFYGGPHDKLTTLVYAKQLPTQIKVPEDLVFPGLVEDITGKSYKKIMAAIYGGVKKAYEKNDLPYIEVLITEINEYAIGQFLQFKMCEMMYLAQLLNVNAFNQPAVEDYKDETRELLKS
ncbi:MAG: hypothetical protein CMI52_00950 [Parcubacteria group bacterium]|nr:hypothetical protein [Parcubacteria group bacterium]